MKKWCVLLVFLCMAMSTQGRALKDWRTYEDCTLKKERGNDGDSFHVRFKSEKGHYRYYFIRLYFVDTPETDEGLEERLKDQAEYFGISVKETLALAKQASEFTKEFLKDGFTIHTRFQDARGRSDDKRSYGMVQVGDKYLSHELVKNGLARIHGYRPDLPDGTKSKTYLWRLNSAEREAKDQERGGWQKQRSRIEELQMQARQGSAPPPATRKPELPPGVRNTAVRAMALPGPEEEEPAEIVPGDMVLNRTIEVFSLKDAGRKVGLLKAGADVEILGEEPGDMVRIRFSAGEGRMYEAQCRRRDLGL
jgi:endonuclease YncB( thermonuclease family)